MQLKLFDVNFVKIYLYRFIKAAIGRIHIDKIYYLVELDSVFFW